MRAALEGPVKCSVSDCPGILKPTRCGFEGMKMKVAGAKKIRIKGKFDGCGCEKVCDNRDADYWLLKSTDGRCTCYTGGELKKVIDSKSFISSHGNLRVS